MVSKTVLHRLLVTLGCHNKECHKFSAICCRCEICGRVCCTQWRFWWGCRVQGNGGDTGEACRVHCTWWRCWWVCRANCTQWSAGESVESTAHSRGTGEVAESTIYSGGTDEAAELTAHCGDAGETIEPAAHGGGAGEAAESTAHGVGAGEAAEPTAHNEVLVRLLCLLDALESSQFFSSFRGLSAFFLYSFLCLSKSDTFLLLYHPDLDSSYSLLFLIQGCCD